MKAIPNKKSITICNAFSAWIKESKNKGIKIQYVRTDDGGEYGDLTSLLTSLGITHQLTAPDILWSNVKVEHLNRTLGEICPAMLYHANMLAIFWAEVMTTAAFVINFLLSKAVDNQIPWTLEWKISLDRYSAKIASFRLDRPCLYPSSTSLDGRKDRYMLYS